MNVKQQISLASIGHSSFEKVPTHNLRQITSFFSEGQRKDKRIAVTTKARMSAAKEIRCITALSTHN